MMTPQKNPMFWDVRMIELRMRRGEITQKEWQAYVASLPDVADKATVCNPLNESEMALPFSQEMSELSSDESELDDSYEDEEEDESFSSTFPPTSRREILP